MSVTGTVHRVEEVTYHRGTQSQCSSADTSDCPSDDERGVVICCRLYDAANDEYNGAQEKSLLPRPPIGYIRIEPASDKGAKQEHARHEALAECRFCLRDDGVELREHVDNAHDTLIIAKGEAAQGGQKGGREDVRPGREDPLHATWSVVDILTKQIRVGMGFHIGGLLIVFHLAVGLSFVHGGLHVDWIC